MPVRTLTDEDLEDCEKILGHRFGDLDLLERALTHASASRSRLDSNERLEFLGDAILGAVVCEELFRRFPDRDEGELTRMKSEIVSRAACARMTEDLGLEDFVKVGKGVAGRGHRGGSGSGRGAGGMPSSILACALEAVIGALYIDGGYDVARRFVLECTELEVDDATDAERNAKSELQQRGQREFGRTPFYKVISTRGPDHSRLFQVAAVVDGETFSSAWGSNKKEAEQRAAENALAELDGQDPPFEK